MPGIEPGIDINADTSEVGVSVTSDTVPATGQMHQQSNGISEAPNPITPPGPGANGVPEQPVPNSPPGGTLAPKGDMSAGQQMGGMTMMTTPAVDHQSTSTEGSQVPVVATHYYRGHDGQVIYYSNGGGYSYYGPRHYAHQPYDYQYPYRGYAYYPYEDYYLYYNYNWGW